MYQAEGNLLEDEVLIDSLAASKKTSIQIATKLEEAVATEKTLDAVRVLYAPVAQRFASPHTLLSFRCINYYLELLCYTNRPWILQMWIPCISSH